jgi:hypothetical protein
MNSLLEGVGLKTTDRFPSAVLWINQSSSTRLILLKFSVFPSFIHSLQKSSNIIYSMICIIGSEGVFPEKAVRWKKDVD